MLGGTSELNNLMASDLEPNKEGGAENLKVSVTSFKGNLKFQNFLLDNFSVQH